MMYLLISIIVVGIVLQIGVPYLNRLRAYSEIKNLQETMIDLDETISIVASEGEDSQRQFSITLSEDSMDINGLSELITVKKETEARIMNPRSRKSQGNYFYGVSLETDAYASTLEDTNVYVLENEHIYFSVRRLDENTQIKAENLVTRIHFKDSDADLNALIDFYMDSDSATDLNIATSFTKSGYNIGWGEIKAAVSNSTYSYNVFFRLESGSDFVRAWVSDAIWG